MHLRLSPLAIATIFFSTSLLPIGRAERVGYQFSGYMTPPPSRPGLNPPDTYSIFNVLVPVHAVITGTFSYDIPSSEARGPDNSRVYRQAIQGGLTFDAFGSNETSILHIVANQYTVTVNNDFLPQNTPSPIDSFEVDLIPPPGPFLANNSSITSTKSRLSIPFNWDEQTFTGNDQPYLWPDLPPVSDVTVGLIGTFSAPGAFDVKTLTRIQPRQGDYNVDGQVDANDYLEWRNAFGDSDPPHAYADGNGNGIVDGADYVVWRSAQSLSNASSASVPEPSLAALMAVASIVIGSFTGRRA